MEDSSRTKPTGSLMKEEIQVVNASLAGMPSAESEPTDTT